MMISNPKSSRPPLQSPTFKRSTADMAPCSTPMASLWRLSCLVALVVSSLASCSVAESSSMSFEVLQYNVFGRPTEVSSDGQHERLSRIPTALLTHVSSSIDVVTFAEADIKGEREAMLAQFQTLGFNYSTSILHDPDPFTSLLNGGVLIVSKWPIVREAQHVYRGACHYSDCLAAKGVKYARVLKTEQGTSKVFNVFATHMQAWSTPQGRDDRVKQAQQMREFVDAFELPHHEPVIFAGDFNVDNHTFADEVDHLVELLGAHRPQQIGDQEYTSDPRTNVLVGRDGAANSNKCSAQYEQSWGPLENGTFHPTLLTRVPCSASYRHRQGVWDHLFHRTRTPVYVPMDAPSLCYCACCPKEWLDYVLYAKAPYQQPLSTPTLQSFALQLTQAPFAVDWSASKASHPRMEMVDLSDHYPVLGKFEFEVTRTDSDPLEVHLDGCSSDDDCKFRAFRCYCDSAENCYFQGKNQSGWELDSHHPINRNCLLQKTSVQCLCGPN